jgi:hypothetical protein
MGLATQYLSAHLLLAATVTERGENFSVLLRLLANFPLFLLFPCTLRGGNWERAVSEL